MQGAANIFRDKGSFLKMRGFAGYLTGNAGKGREAEMTWIPFDSEEVVRAVRSCPVPVIQDWAIKLTKHFQTLPRMLTRRHRQVLQKRVFPIQRTHGQLKSSMRSMNAHINKRAAKISSDLTDSKRRLLFSITRGVYIPASEFLNNARSSLSSNITYKLSEAEAKLSSAAGTLNNLSPLSVMSRGFTVCRGR